jgi:hypothetical protein
MSRSRTLRAQAEQQVASCHRRPWSASPQRLADDAEFRHSTLDQGGLAESHYSCRFPRRGQRFWLGVFRARRASLTRR